MKKLLPILVVVMFAVACGTGYFVYGAYKDYRGESSSVVSDSVVEVSDSNQEVESKISNQSYYYQIGEYIEQLMLLKRGTFDAIQKNGLTEQNKDELLDITNDFILFSQSFNPQPLTSNDEILHEHFIDLKYDAEMMADYTLQYIYKKDSVYRNLHRDYFENVRIHLDTMSRIEKQYYM